MAGAITSSDKLVMVQRPIKCYRRVCKYSSRAVQIAAGGSHTLAINSAGNVFAWGYNAAGQLGDGSRTNRATPVVTRDANGRGQLTGVSMVAAGWYHSLALKNGDVWAWGLNAEGQLGDGSRQTRLLPVRVRGLSNVVAIAAGTRFSVAVKDDGTIWTWGQNNASQLGATTPSSRAVPGRVEIGGNALSNIAKVAAGDAFVLALTHDGRVISWGENGDGQLGHTGNAPAPMQNAGGMVAVAAGFAHSLTLNGSGQVFVCGNNFYGQLGNGTQIFQVLCSRFPASMMFKPSRPAPGTAWRGAARGHCGRGVTTFMVRLATARTKIAPFRHAFEV